MGFDHTTRRGRFLVATGAFLVRAVVRLFLWTCRVEVIAGREHLENARREKKAHVLSFWHNRSILAARALLGELHRHDFDILVLASQSRDGELVTKVAEGFGLDVVRGSASRGGSGAVRAIYRAVTRRGSSPVMIPDGPRGPRYQFKIGVVILAQLAQAPILPMGMAAKRFLVIPSWDRLILPWPFSRIALVVGEPQEVPRQLGSEELEAERQRLEVLLSELTRQAEEALGVGDPAAA